MSEVNRAEAEDTSEIENSDGKTPPIVVPAGEPKPGMFRRMANHLLGCFRRVDEATNGYVPLFCWLVLLFGGIWFPATPILEHIFEDAATPRGLLLGTSVHVGVVAGDNTDTTTSQETAGAENADQSSGSSRLADKAIKHIEPSTAAWLLIPCLLFWTWTNIALLCVMASAMGEVNRCAETPGAKPNFRSSCTRAFFVYLFVLLNELAVAGSLTAGIEIQGTYTRIAVLASLLCFVSSYRPTFYSGLVSRFSTTQDGSTDGMAPGKQEASKPGQVPGPKQDVNRLDADAAAEKLSEEFSS